MAKRKVDRNRELIVLHDILGWSYRRIGEVYGMHRATVQQVIQREKLKHSYAHRDIPFLKKIADNRHPEDLTA